MPPYLYFSKDGTNYQHALNGVPANIGLPSPLLATSLREGDDDQIVALMRKIFQGENDDDAPSLPLPRCCSRGESAIPNEKGSRRPTRGSSSDLAKSAHQSAGTIKIGFNAGDGLPEVLEPRDLNSQARREAVSERKEAMTDEDRLFVHRAKALLREIKGLTEQIQQVETVESRIELHRRQDTAYQTLDDLFKSEVDRLQDEEAAEAHPVSNLGQGAM